MTSLSVGVVGASGRTGRFVVEALQESSSCDLAAAIVSTGSAVLGQSVPGGHVRFSSDYGDLLRCQVVIDFGTAESSVRVAQACREGKVPLLVATTGHSEAQRSAIQSASKDIPLCLASNTSIGATALAMASEYVQAILGSEFDIEVVEIHHKMKRDAPSGTATTVAAGLVPTPEALVFNRHGMRAPSEVGVVSLRGGDIPGDHTVYFLGHGERVELKHSVHDRRVFGRGAVVLASKLATRSAGLYSVRELLVPDPRC